MIEDYINDINMAEVISGSIKVLIEENEELKQRIDKAIEYCEKQKRKMYKSRNKIAMFILIKLLEILKGSDKE